VWAVLPGIPRALSAGASFRPVVEAMGRWGYQWAAEQLRPDNPDARLLMWFLRRRVQVDRLPADRSGGRGCWVADELADGGGEFVGVGERGEVIQLGQALGARIGQHLGQDRDVLAEPGAGVGAAEQECRCRDPGRLGRPEGPGGHLSLRARGLGRLEEGQAGDQAGVVQGQLQPDATAGGVPGPVGARDAPRQLAAAAGVGGDAGRVGRRRAVAVAGLDRRMTRNPSSAGCSNSGANQALKMPAWTRQIASPAPRSS
jgi:hypothetical protein